VGHGRGDVLAQSVPEWVAKKSMVNLAGSAAPSPIIADNNIGFVTIDMKEEISHALMVRQEKEDLPLTAVVRMQ
jgi:hypothetical protein